MSSQNKKQEPSSKPRPLTPQEIESLLKKAKENSEVFKKAFSQES